MKKILALLLALVMVVGLVACGEKTDAKDPTNNPTTSTNDPTTGTDTETPSQPEGGDEVVEPALTVVEYALLDLYNLTPMEFPVMTWALDLTDTEAFKSFTGLDSAEGIVAAAVTEPAMSSQAYSVVLVQVADVAKAQDIAKAMEEGINPAKWVCVEADDLKTVVVDNYVMLVMMSSDFKETATSETITSAFVEMMKTWEAPADATTTPVTPDGTDGTEATEPAEGGVGDAIEDVADAIVDATTEAVEGTTEATTEGTN